MRTLKFLSLAAALLVFAPPTRSAEESASGPLSPAPSLWEEVTNTAALGLPRIRLTHKRALSLDGPALLVLLARAPQEGEAREPVVLPLPLPEGGFGRFAVVASPVMASELAARYPGFGNWRGQGLDDPTASVRLDWTPRGLHAGILAVEGSVYIDPWRDDDTEHYLVYDTRNQLVEPDAQKPCLLIDTPGENAGAARSRRGPPDKSFDPVISFGDRLHTYRLAVAATGEYTSYHGGTVTGGLAAIVTSVNRLNLVYERELALRLELVADNDLIVYTDPATDPYTNDDLGAMISENMANLDAVIGHNNFDIGHVFGTIGGGGAGFSICEPNKAGGATGLTDPIGDPFTIDYVAHELGHQFHGSHSFDNCNGTTSTPYEPGSGSTIMAYGGICGPPFDIQSNSDAYLHSYNIFDEMAWVTQESVGRVCGTLSDSGNQPPIPTAGTGGHTIPRATPFELTGSAVDPDGDALSYLWEELDYGGGTSPDDPTSPPFFRSWPASSNPTRVFPRLTELVNNTTVIGEVLPEVDRTLEFRFIVRDNRSGGGGVAYDRLSLALTSAAGPFLVTQPDTPVIWVQGSVETVSWEVAGTQLPPVDCAAVNIRLSTDGGFTYPVMLATNETNDGTALIEVPNAPTTTARVKVKCADNVFFDISNSDFTITGVPDFMLQTSDADSTVCLGSDAQFTLALDSVLGFAQPVTLSVTGDSGGTPVLLPNPVTPPAASVLTVQAPTAGIHGFQMIATSGPLSHTLPLRLVVAGGLPAEPASPWPIDGATEVAVRPVLSWEATPGAISYELEITRDPDFTDPVLAAGVATNRYLSPTLSHGTSYYWRVRALNVCGRGTWSPFTFMTEDPPLCGTQGFIIPDGDAAVGASETIEIAQSGQIEDLDLGIEIAHTWVGDLELTLEHLDTGTSVLLMDQPNGNDDCNGDHVEAVLDDEATVPINESCAPTVPCISGGFVPESALSGFDGEDLTGSWRLTARDHVEVDTGALLKWCLLPTLAATPGESSGPSYSPLLVSKSNPPGSGLTLQFESACEATDNDVHYGPLSAVESYGWWDAACGIGAGTDHQGFMPGDGSWFFVVVGNKNAVEGSYGKHRLSDGSWSERPPFSPSPCGRVQSLRERCD